MYIDIFLIIFILIGIIQGYHRGVIRTLFAILGLLIGILATLKFAPYVVTFLESVFSLSPLLALILGMILTFLLILAGIRWLGKSLENTLKVARINFLNKIAGAVLFSLLMIVIYSMIIWFIDRTGLLGESEKPTSRSYAFLQEVPARTGKVLDKAKPVFQGFWEKMEKFPGQDEKEEKEESAE